MEGKLITLLIQNNISSASQKFGGKLIYRLSS
jgi:hypothetical protein